jgi:hypothetical protein
MPSRKEVERRYVEYLEKAAESQQVAEVIGNPADRQVWKDIAEHWMSLAELMQQRLVSESRSD